LHWIFEDKYDVFISFFITIKEKYLKMNTFLFDVLSITNFQEFLIFLISEIIIFLYFSFFLIQFLINLSIIFNIADFIIF